MPVIDGAAEHLTSYVIESRQAFNSGSDARLAGLPLCDNPRESDTGKLFWAMGWKDVDRFWGVLCRGRPVRKLPVIAE